MQENKKEFLITGRKNQFIKITEEDDGFYLEDETKECSAFNELKGKALYHSKDGCLFNMNCMDILPSLPSESVDLIVTDPPYRVTSKGNAGNSGGMLQKDINKKGKVFTHNSIDIETYVPECYRLLKDGSHFYIMTNHKNLIDMLNTCTSVGFHFIKSLIWDKGNKIMGQYYMSQFEYILFFRKGKGVKINNCGTPDILSIPNIKTKSEHGKNLHDTEKPVELMKILIENSTKQKDIVLDPFVGVGGVVRACLETSRYFIASEIDNTYSDITLKYIKDYKNKNLDFTTIDNECEQVLTLF